MRHLEPLRFNHNNSSVNNIKEESLDLDCIKEEIPNLILAQYDGIIKNSFPSDGENVISNVLELPLSPESELEETYELLSKQNEVLRRNRRKPLLPQRAVQSEFSRNSSFGNSSECSQDVPDNALLNINEGLITSSERENDFFDLAEGDDLLQDIDEENIFKGLREEAGMFLSYYFYYRYFHTHSWLYLPWLQLDVEIHSK